MIHRMKELGVNPTMLQAAWDKNLEVREEEDWFDIEGAASNKSCAESSESSQTNQ